MVNWLKMFGILAILLNSFITVFKTINFDLKFFKNKFFEENKIE